MHYRGELFYRLHTVEFSSRARLYHYACKLARHSHVVVSVSEQRCSLWISLRSPLISTFQWRRQVPSPFVNPPFVAVGEAYSTDDLAAGDRITQT